MREPNTPPFFVRPGEAALYSVQERKRTLRETLVREVFDSDLLKQTRPLVADSTHSMSSKRQGPADMYNMAGFANLDVITEQLSFKIRNLVDKGDFEVQEIQRELLQVLAAELFSMPEKTEGLILHSGSEANEAALFLAKQATQKKMVLTSNLTHQSVARACDKLDMEAMQIDVDPTFGYGVSAENLESFLTKYADKLAAVVMTAGTTQLGTNEGFSDPPLGKFCRENDIWLHIDAAYGGTIMNLISDEYPSGIYPHLTEARSVTVDAHKFVGVYGCSALLLPRWSGQQLIGPEVSYFESKAAALGTTRSAFEAAVALATMKALGREGLKKLAHTCHNKAVAVADRLEKGGLHMMVGIESGVVPIELGSQRAVNYMRATLKEKGFLVSPIHIKGENYEKWGIRIVVTPKAEMTDENLQKFTEAAITAYKEMPD